MKSDEEIEKEINEKYKDLPEGLYQIGYSPYIAMTGRQGYINYQISLEKGIRDVIYKLK